MKLRVFKEKGIEVDCQKIVFKGKVPNDTDTLSGISVKENDHMVVMVMKVSQNEETSVKGGFG